MSLDFVNQLLATISAPTTVALSTPSLPDALPISFAASGDFAATSTGASACPTSPATLPAGANCTINVTFTPTASGARTGTLSLTDNSSDKHTTELLTDDNIVRRLRLEKTNPDIGNQLLAATRVSLTVTLPPPSSTPFPFTTLFRSGDFAATSTGASACPTSPATLPAGANCTINVTFTPTASGARTGTLSLTDN